MNSVLRRGAGLAAAAVLTTSMITTNPAAEAGRGHGKPHGHHASHQHKRAVPGAFTRLATMPAYTNASIDETAVAEISTITPDGRTVVYTDAGGKRIGFVDVRNGSKPRPRGTLEVGGEPTSVYATGRYILVCVDKTDGDFAHPKGALLVLDAKSHQLIREIDLGGQPDSIDVSPDGKWATIAIENQRNEEFTPEGLEEGDIPQAPAGFLATVRLHKAPKRWSVQRTTLTGLKGMVAADDPEPEYVKISPNGRYAALTLQENNHIAIIDFRRNKVVRHYSAGTVSASGFDTKKDGVINPTGKLTDQRREPDSIGWIDNSHVATANEGDWVGGTRGWTVFDAFSGRVVWDAGNSLEQLVIANGSWNESRAGKKGIEPEGLAVATYHGVRYAFVGSERSNIVAVYDVTNPARPRYLQMLPSTNGPEGILPVPSRDLLVVSSETDERENGVRASVQLYGWGKDQRPTWPQITAASGIGWGALGALTADEKVPGRLWSATDAAYADTKVLSIDATRTPAVITRAIPVTKDGKQVSLEVEGLWRIPGGLGFWLGVEGASGAKNKLVRIDATGAVQQEVSLPAGYTAKLGKQGIESVTGTPDGKVLYVAMQREAKGEDVTRIGRYEVATGEWTFYGYQLEKTTVDGDWLGLSEIALVNPHTLAVIERDKLNGPAAAVKRIYTVTIDGKGVADGEELPVLAKTLAKDVLPVLKADNGWTQEKLEGMTIDAAGNVFVITDNDGLKDATGETVFTNLGKVFG